MVEVHGPRKTAVSEEGERDQAQWRGESRLEEERGGQEQRRRMPGAEGRERPGGSETNVPQEEQEGLRAIDQWS